MLNFVILMSSLFVVSRKYLVRLYLWLCLLELKTCMHTHKITGSISSKVCAEIGERNDYVVRDPAENSLSDYYLPSPRPTCSTYDSQLATGSYSDSRNSQFFETIQESLSGRSSPASSKYVQCL